MKPDSDKIQGIDTNPNRNSMAPRHKSNRYSRNQRLLKEPVDASTDNDHHVNMPRRNEESCIKKYPISCISENWEIISCQIFLHQYETPQNNFHPNNNYLSNNQSMDMSFSTESEGCTNFKVHLEHMS